MTEHLTKPSWEQDYHIGPMWEYYNGDHHIKELRVYIGKPVGIPYSGILHGGIPIEHHVFQTPEDAREFIREEFPHLQA